MPIPYAIEGGCRRAPIDILLDALYNCVNLIIR